MSELFTAYYNGIPIGIIIGFTSYFLGCGVGSFLSILKVSTD